MEMMILTLNRTPVFSVTVTHLGWVEVEVGLRSTDCDGLLWGSQAGGGAIGGEVGAGVVEDAVVSERELAQ